MSPRLLRVLPLFVLLLWLSGCASYYSRIREPRLDFESGNYESAIEKLKELAEKRDTDELLYLMELGTVYHVAGRYREAIAAFTRADKLAEIKDYTSLSAEAGAVLLNEGVKTYKGEDFEKILINVYLAIDYTLSGQWESALVECRRVNQKLDRMIAEGKRPYKNNAFAKYLAATLFEAQGELNDAFVDYRTLLKWNHADFPYLAGPLTRVADLLQASQESAEYRRKFPGAGKYRVGRGEGQLVVLFEQGRAPYKIPSPDFRLIPIFHRNASLADHAVVRLADGKGGEARTYPLFDIEETAVKELDEKAAAIVATKVGGMVVKQAAAYGVSKATKSEFLGALTSILLHASDQADLRSWNTLPATLQLARMVVPAGRHDVVLDMVTSTGAEIKGAKRWPGVEIKPGKIVFLDFRSVE